MIYLSDEVLDRTPYVGVNLMDGTRTGGTLVDAAFPRDGATVRSRAGDPLRSVVQITLLPLKQEVDGTGPELEVVPTDRILSMTFFKPDEIEEPT